MQQHPPSIPIANAAMPAAVPPPYRTTWRRLLAIVMLGLTASLFFSPTRVGPWWWQPVVAAAVLFGAVLVNAISIRSAGSGLSIGWALRGPGATGMVTGVLGVVIIMLAGLSYTTTPHRYPVNMFLASVGWALLEGMLVAVLVGLVSALVAQPQPSTPLALLGIILGWTAATVANLAGWALGPSGITSPSIAAGTVVLSTLVFLFYAGGGGLPFAVLGGLLSKRLRALAENSATKG